jgi:hypothetical protein
VDDQQGFIIGVSGRGAPIEAACDHCFVVDHCELVVELVAAGESWCADALYLQWF